MRAWPDACVDAVVCDPPYGLEFMGKDWDKLDGDAWRAGGTFTKPGIGDRATAWPAFGAGDTANATCAGCGGRMRGAKRCSCETPDWRVKGLPLAESGSASRQAQGQKMQAWHEAWAREAFRVLKPGGHLVAFGGSRTYHRLACALEDAGFEIRDSLMWLYGSGFPKSLNLKDERKSWGTALKPAHEPCVLARKPLEGTVAANVQKWGTGALNIDGCRIESGENRGRPRGTFPHSDDAWGDGRLAATESHPGGRWPANVVLDEEAGAMLDAQSPVSGTPKKYAPQRRLSDDGGMFGLGARRGGGQVGDVGGASRFFYCPKVSRKERDLGCEDLDHHDAQGTTNRKPGAPGTVNPRAGAGHNAGGPILRCKHCEVDGGGGRRVSVCKVTEEKHTEADWVQVGVQARVRNNHPTVKPIALMAWLIRLVTPPGGVVLDPFMGSGSTGIAALREGARFVGIERDKAYFRIATARIGRAQQGEGDHADERDEQREQQGEQ